MASDDTRQRLTVRAGGARVAMAAAGVAEVIRTPRVTRVPHGPPGLLGVTHLRGLVLPVVSLGALLGDDHPADSTRVVVLRRDPPIGLAVDTIETLTASEGDGQVELQHGRLMLDDASGARGSIWTRRCRIGSRPSAPRAARPSARSPRGRRSRRRRTWPFWDSSWPGRTTPCRSTPLPR